MFPRHFYQPLSFHARSIAPILSYSNSPFKASPSPPHNTTPHVPNRKFLIEGGITDGVIEVGSYAEISHTFSQDDVNTFASLCGDDNPVHINPEYASETVFKGTIVHGILVSSLYSTLFGRCIKGSIYVSQSLAFKRPVHIGTEIIAKIQILEIENKRNRKLLTCSTQCFIKATGQLAVDGEAKVLIS